MSLSVRRTAFQSMALLAAILLGSLACFQLYDYVHKSRELKRQVMAKGRHETQRTAEAIDALLRTLEPEVRSLAADLSAGRLSDSAIQARLAQGLERTPAAYRMGINYVPFAKDPRKELVSFDVIRENGTLRSYGQVKGVNYPAQNWFQADLKDEGWHEPHMSQTIFQVVTGFSLFIHKPGDPNGGPIGVVRMDLSLAAIRELLASASLGRAGYSCLLSPKGTILAHPKHDWVLDGRTLFQVAQETNDPVLWHCGEMAQRGVRGELETVSYAGGQPIILFSEPIASTHWTLESAVFKDEATLGMIATRRAFMDMAFTLLGLAGCLGMAVLGRSQGEMGPLWRWQTLLSGLLAAGVVLLWSLTLLYPDPVGDQTVAILSQEHLQKYLASRNRREAAEAGAQAMQVPTGVFLKTLRFDHDNDVVVTGLVWMRYPAAFPGTLNRGFLFPNAEDLEVSEAFHRKDDKGELIEYPFKAVLRQHFETTAKFPFDQVVIRLPLWPKDFDAQVSLVPDLEAYHVLNPGSLPGVEKSLVLPGWTMERSYFGFQEPTYGTNFGSGEKNNVRHPPELSFQLVLSRQFLDPFISAMLPVLVVGCLLFFTLLVVTGKGRGLEGGASFKAIDILPVTATLLFPVIYAQINLRSSLTSSSLLYLEYFYFVMYAVILLVGANALLFALGKDGLVHREDNLLAKLLYWPVVLGAFFVISLIFLY